MLDKAYYKLSCVYFQIKDYEKAAAAFKEMTEKYPKSELAADALFRLGESLYEEGKYEEGAKAYRKLAKEYPKHELVANALLKSGLCSFKSKDW